MKEKLIKTEDNVRIYEERINENQETEKIGRLLSNICAHANIKQEKVEKGFWNYLKRAEKCILLIFYTFRRFAEKRYDYATRNY